MEALADWLSNINYNSNLKLSIENQSSKLSQIRYDLTCVARSGRSASHKRKIILRLSADVEEFHFFKKH